MSDIVFTTVLAGATSRLTFGQLPAGVASVGASVEMLGIGSATPVPALAVSAVTNNSVTVLWSNYTAGRQVTVKITVYVSEAVISGSTQILTAATVVVAGDLEVLGSITSAGGLTSSFYIDAAEYGLSTSATGVVNRAAMAAAVAAAQAAQLPLLISSGNYNIDVAATQNTGAIPITGAVEIFGAGIIGQTVFTATGYSPATGATMFRCAPGAGYSVSISNIKLVGPNASLMTEDINVAWAFWLGGGVTITYQNVEFRKWMQATKASPEYPTYPGLGNKQFYRSCEIGFYVTGPLHIEGTTSGYDIIEFDDCEFEWDSAIVPVPIGAGSNGSYDATYVNVGVSFAMNNCRVLSTGGHTAGTASSGWLHYGGSGVPLYARCTNTSFAALVRCGMINASTTTTLVTDCTFNIGATYSAMNLRGDIDISVCSFNAYGLAAYGILDGNAIACAVNATTCTFTKVTTGFNYYARRLVASASKVWTFANCTFGSTDTGGSCVGVDAGTVVLNTCVFTGTTGVYSVRLQGGRANLISCQTTGTKPHYVDTASAAATLYLWGCSWAQSAATEINTASGLAISILGGECTTFSNEGFRLSGSTPANITGQFQCARGGAGSYSYSAGTLQLSVNGDTYLINEGAGPTINDINMLGSSGVGNTAADRNRMMTATVKLYVTQAFTLGAAGNIVAAGGARAVASIVTLQYFPTLTKWVEV